MNRLLVAVLAVSCAIQGGSAAGSDVRNAAPQCIPSSQDQTCDNPKVSSMEFYRARTHDGDLLTTNQGVKIADNQNSLRAGERGPTLLEDFIFRYVDTSIDPNGRLIDWLKRLIDLLHQF